MSTIDFSKLDEMLKASPVFSLTEAQYRKLTGRELPKDSSYLVKKSALARFARKNGLRIRVQERMISFEKESSSIQ